MLWGWGDPFPKVGEGAGGWMRDSYYFALIILRLSEPSYLSYGSSIEFSPGLNGLKVQSYTWCKSVLCNHCKVEGSFS